MKRFIKALFCTLFILLICGGAYLRFFRHPSVSFEENTEVFKYNLLRSGRYALENYSSRLGMDESIWPVHVAPGSDVLEYKMIRNNSSEYLGYLAVKYPKTLYKKELSRLKKYRSTDYRYYSVVGTERLLAVNADSRLGFIYALGMGNNTIVYVEEVFDNYCISLDYEKYIPEEYLLNGFDAYPDNIYKITNKDYFTFPEEYELVLDASEITGGTQTALTGAADGAEMTDLETTEAAADADMTDIETAEPDDQLQADAPSDIKDSIFHNLDLYVTSIYNSKILLAWNRIRGCEYYELYCDDELIAKTDATSCLMINAEPGRDYRFMVRAVGPKKGKLSRIKTIRTRYRKPIALMIEQGEKNEELRQFFRDSGFDLHVTYSRDEINADEYDALIIPGGGDVDPSLYGQLPNPENYKVDIHKDEIQMYAIQMFMDADKPVYGICRGEQLINVMLGGDLIQHIEGHMLTDRVVNIAKDSLLYGIYGSEVNTYHYHHQTVGELGRDLVVTQTDAEDGTIEGIEHLTKPVYGYQWHPEDMGEAGLKTGYLFRDICLDNLSRYRSEPE